MVGSLSPSDLAVRAHGEAIAEVIPSASTLASLGQTVVRSA